MGGLWCLFCFALGNAVVRPTAVSGQEEEEEEEEEEGVPALFWASLALSFVMVLVVVLLMKWLRKRCQLGNGQEAKEKSLPSQEELRCRLWQSFTQMEKEMVKLVTLVRNRKAKLAACHRSCKVLGCQEEKGSPHKPFNLAVYDVAKED